MSAFFSTRTICFCIKWVKIVWDCPNFSDGPIKNVVLGRLKRVRKSSFRSIFSSQSESRYHVISKFDPLTTEVIRQIGDFCVDHLAEIFPTDEWVSRKRKCRRNSLVDYWSTPWGLMLQDRRLSDERSELSKLFRLRWRGHNQACLLCGSHHEGACRSRWDCLQWMA